MTSNFARKFRVGAFPTIAAILFSASVLKAEAQRTESTSANVQTIVEYPASVTAGEPGSVRITFNNRNAFEVVMIQTEGLFFYWRIEVREATSGSIIAPHDAGRALLGAENASMIDHVWLKPGESTSWNWRIDSLYALNPGRYRISINRRFWTRKNEAVDVTVPEFEIEVKA